MQIEATKQTGIFVERGFSGSPVWNEQTEGILGVVVAAEKRSGVRVAFVIPGRTLIAFWPELGEFSIPPCPYKGLLAFREKDAPFFFGRDVFVERAAEALRRQPLLAVVGPSGSGKSSVVFAGVVPVSVRR